MILNLVALCAICIVHSVPIYVINLKQRLDRYVKFRMKFYKLRRESQVDVEFHLIDATDSEIAAELINNFTVVIDPKFKDPYSGRVLKLGEVGCMHSHYRAWQAVARQSADENDWAVVVEDDVTFFDSFAANYQNWRHVSPQLDLVFYSHKKIDTSSIPTVLAPGIETFVYSYWAVAYALTAKAARKLIAGPALSQLIPADEYLPKQIAAGLRAASYEPQIASPTFDSESAIISDTETSALVNSSTTLLLVLTVATNELHAGFLRLQRSARYFGYTLINVAKSGQQWQGGNVATGPGGGHKFTLVKQYLAAANLSDNKLVMFVDGYDTLFIKGVEQTLQMVNHVMKSTDHIVFAVEKYCWPDKSLEHKFPASPHSEFRFVNSGTYVGYAKALRRFFNSWDSARLAADDQLFVTKKYLKKRTRVQLDARRQLFQTLAGVTAEEFTMGHLENRVHFYDKTTSGSQIMLDSPSVLHGNGGAASKSLLMQLANYEAGAWSSFYGSMWHHHRRVEDHEGDILQSQTVLLAVMCYDTPFPEQFFDKLQTLRVDFEHTHIFLWRCETVIGHEWRSNFVSVSRSRVAHPLLARSKALFVAREKSCRYALFVDSSVFIKDPLTLVELLKDNLSLVAPHAQKPGELFSNFWLAYGDSGWYEPQFNDLQIYKAEHRGLWEVPYIMNIYLAHESVYGSLDIAFEECAGSTLDADVCVCNKLREDGVPMYVDNRRLYAEMLTSDRRVDTGADVYYRDLFEGAANPAAWDRAYLTKSFSNKTSPVTEPCPDVFGVSVFNERFCTELVFEMERYGKWSGGGTYDPRITGGKENVPTQDIHLNQIGFEETWLAVLRRHLFPQMAELYEGSHFEERINIAFVVRYITSGQLSLRAHQDSAAVTTVTTLSTDFEGGGARFTRYNCTHISKELGVTTYHPGRITHTHEGLPITSGRRYILVSFNE